MTSDNIDSLLSWLSSGPFGIVAGIIGAVIVALVAAWVRKPPRPDPEAVRKFLAGGPDTASDLAKQNDQNEAWLAEQAAADEKELRDDTVSTK